MKYYVFIQIPQCDELFLQNVPLFLSLAFKMIKDPQKW